MRFLLLLSVFWFLFCPDVQALPQRVRVHLFEARKTVPEVKIKGAFRVVSPISKALSGRGAGCLVRVGAGKVNLYTVPFLKSKVPSKRTYRIGELNRLLSAPRIVLEPREPGGIELVFPGRSPCRYQGSLTISVGRSGGANSLDVVNDVPARDFVYGVVASELPHDFHSEAKKALAVLTLTRLEFLPDRRAIGDSTKSELYTGCGRVTDSLKALIDEVFDKRLYYKGHLVLPYYHSTCSGFTSSGSAFFMRSGADYDYLEAVPCNHCKKSPFFEFKTARVKSVRVESMFNGALPVVQERDGFGRPLSVRVRGRSEPLSGYKTWILLGRELGWGKIPGTRYYLNTVSDHLEIKSSGAGHGVGLCQWGADGLARQGKSYTEILSYYFPRAKVK